jgi:hypothetical protein
MKLRVIAWLLLSTVAARAEEPPAAPEPPAACLTGQLPLVGDDNAPHCCWPGQSWSGGACHGVATCPSGLLTAGERCVRPMPIPAEAPPVERERPAAPAAPAAAYRAGSHNLLTSSTLTINSLSGGIAAVASLGIGGDVVYRHVFAGGVTVQPRLGLTVLGEFGSSGSLSIILFRPGLGVGFAFAPGERVAFTPLVAYDLLFLFAQVGGVGGGGQSELAHAVALELPLTIFLGGGLFLEVLATGGVLYVPAMAFSREQILPSFSIGHRFGISF